MYRFYLNIAGLTISKKFKMSTDKKNTKENHLMIWDELKWVPSEKQLAQFIHLQELLKEWNKKSNLTRLVLSLIHI